MLKLALASLRFRMAASLATFVAVLIGCALLVTCGALLETAIRLDAPPKRLAAAPIIVAGPDGYRLNNTPEVIPYSEQVRIPDSWSDMLSKVSGVDRVVPDISFTAVLQGQEDITAADTYGHAWSSAALAPYYLHEGKAPQAGQVVLDSTTANRARLHVGDATTIIVGGAPHTFTVAGLIMPRSTTDAPLLYFSAGDAARFYPARGKVDAFGVFVKPGMDANKVAERLQQSLPADASILTGDGRGKAEFRGVTASRLSLFLLAGIFTSMAVTVLVLVVAATIGLAIRQRQQELALLRATGALPRQVRRMVVIETMIVAFLAILAGVYVGKVGGNWLFTLTASHGVVPKALHFQQGLLPAAGGALVCLVIVWTTTHLAAQAAARTRPIQALLEASIPPVHVGRIRRWLALLFGAATLGIAVVTVFMDLELAVSVGGSAVLIGAIAVGLLAPDIIYTLARYAAKPSTWFARRLGMLMIKNVRFRAGQFVAVLIPLTLGVAIALGNVYSLTTQQAAALRAYLGQFQAQAVVTSTTGSIAPSVADTVQHVPGVATVSRLITSQGWIEQPFDASHGSDPWPLLGVDQASVLDIPVKEGTLHALHGSSVAVPQGQAKKLGISVGDQIGVRFGDGGQARVIVTALLGGPADYASLVLPADLLERHTTTELPSYLLINGSSGQNDTALINSIKQKTGGLPRLIVGDKQILADTFAQQLNVQAWISYILALLAITYAAIASINAWTVITLARRKELAMQRLLGSTRRQMIRMLMLEGLLVTLMAVLLGTILACFAVFPMAVAVGPILPHGPLWVYLAVLVAALLISLPAIVGAGSFATRRKPIEVVNSAIE